jgi:ATP-dependent DNA helicase RecG
MSKPRPPTKAEFEVILSGGEGQFVEFKESVSDSLARELVAFANSGGGRTYVGVADDRTVKGISIDNRLLSQVQDTARNCDPPVKVHLVPFRFKGRDLLMIDVPDGDDKPHSCGGGYYLRTGPNSQKMTRDELVEFMRAAARLDFERGDCRNFVYPRDFDRQAFAVFLKMTGISTAGFSREDLLINLGLARREGPRLVLNNAGALFFAKTPWRFLPQSEIICVLFQTPERLHILDRKDLREGLLENLKQAEAFLLKHLPVRYEIKGFDRIDHPEFPPEVLREGLLNAVMHRDYTVRGGSTFVEVYPDRVAIVNPGGLPPGLSKEDFGKKSVHRNPLIADLLLRAGKVEAVGTGIKRMRDLLSRTGCEAPQFSFTSFFNLVLPRRAALKERGQVAGHVTGQVADALGTHGKTILAYCLTPRALKEVSARTGIRKRDNLMPHLKRLMDSGLLTQTIPGMPRSRFQKYMTTRAGRDRLEAKR